ncbi:sodium-coupled monocarboxylate transporter 1-like [Diadema setosum]|uniref:sodium-coupled monocarboxylate transporter 1-like n=1 Tax=Diadema setosum TaxID=31175 RepID=UPI003B3A4525
MAGTFGVVDYVVLAVMLGISAAIGIFYACTGGKQATAAEFLLADRKANPLAVAFSLVASYISAITVIGTPAEVYFYGSMYWIFAFAFIGAGLITNAFLPVFMKLNITSANEYLQLRFGHVARLIGTIITFITSIFYMAIVIYAPALALNQVTGVNLWGCVVATGVVCTFYTTIGGMKAVIVTDVFQMLVMIAGLLAVLAKGAVELGGLGEVWRICEEGGRIDFWNFNPDPTVRHTFWTITVGGSFLWGSIYGVSQAQVMRYLSCGRLRSARIALGLAIIGMIVVVSLACLAGLVMYAYYADCDPLFSGRVRAPDQLVPFMVVDLYGSTPGLSGLFTAGVVSAALSTVSSGLNALTAVTSEDVIKKLFPNMSPRTYSIVNKVVAVVYGALCMALTYVASILGNILQLALSFGGMFGGPALGLFTLGMFFPWANNVGSIIGILVGQVWSLWVGVGAWIEDLPPQILPLTISGCPLPPPPVVANTTMDPVMTTMMTTWMSTTCQSMASGAGWTSPVAELYTLSYAWLAGSSWLITVIVGMLASLITGVNDPRKMNPALISPIADRLFCCLPESWKGPMRCRVGELYDAKAADLVDGEAMKVTDNGNGIASNLQSYDKTIWEAGNANAGGNQTLNLESSDTKL